MARIKQVAEDLYLLRMDDTHVKYFEAVWEIPEGITYNAYLLKTDDGAVLFDTWKQNYEEEFVEALSSLVDPKEIRHIVVHHMEPDHSGTLPKILELGENKADVWGHSFSKRLIEGLYGISPTFNAIKDGDALEIGGRKLVFFQAPWLHWPETIVTYMPDEGILLTGDIFGGYSIPSGTFDDEADVENYLRFSKKYVITVIGHYKDKIAKNLEKLERLNIAPKMILPAHGLLWRKNPQRIVQAYLDWGEGKPQKGKVVVVYTSMYRFVEKAIKIAIAELEAQGYKPVVHKIVDDYHSSLADILSDVADSEAIVFGTETYESDAFPYAEFILNEMIKKVEYEKPLLLIAIFGWAAAAGKKLRSTIEKTSFNLVDVVEFKGLVTPESETEIKKSIEDLGAVLRRQA